MTEPVSKKVLAQLVMSRRLSRIAKEFEKTYLAKTNCRFDELMPLDIALMLVTGLHRATEAFTKAVEYLMYGVQCVDYGRLRRQLQENLSPIPAPFQATESLLTTPFKRKKFGKRKARKYLLQYKDGLSSWQFIGLAQLLVTGKQAIRTQANRRIHRSKKKS